MNIVQKLPVQVAPYFGKTRGSYTSLSRLSLSFAFVFAWAVFGWGISATAQNPPTPVPVVTEHNDTMRTGQNIGETTLAPAYVNTSAFGKLFSQPLNGLVYAQPLYVPGVTISSTNARVNSTVHNVVYIATNADYVYAFDADSNGGIDAAPLWQVPLLTNAARAGTYTSLFGVQGTPVIDASTSPTDPFAMSMFVVSSETLVAGSVPVFRLHVLNLTSGAEEFGGPFTVQGTVPNATGSGSSNNSLVFNAEYQRQRAGLLMLNGIVYVPFGSVNDNGPWHGWVLSYGLTTNPSTNQPQLTHLHSFCTTPDGSAGGVWMGGAGLAGEVVPNSGKPYGRMFLATGNGSYQISPPTGSSLLPYSNPTNQYAMSVLDLDLTNGNPTVEDEFTPYNQATLNGQDGDLGSGGPILLPAQTLASGPNAGKILDPLIEVGKPGAIYILNRDNTNDGSYNSTKYSPAGLGGFNTSGDQVVQELQTPISGQQGWGAGVWGTEAYWNNNIYYGGTTSGISNPLQAYSFVNGVLSGAPTSISAEKYAYTGPTPSVSANGTTNGIVWVLDNSAYFGGGNAVLAAYDATNLARLLYTSNANLARDNPGSAVELNIPTITNGKVYVGAGNQVDIYGLLASAQQAPAPTIGPATTTYSGTLMVTLSDSIAGATFYYTTNGSTPTVNSNVYSGAFPITASATITAIASVSGMLMSPPTAVTFTSTSDAPNPVFQRPAGSYTPSTSVTITDASSAATIYYTIDGTTPTTASPKYTGAIPVTVSETINAIAFAPNLQPSAVVSSTYTITPNYAINFSNGFSQALSSGLMTFNGSTALDDFRLQLTDGGTDEAGSAFFTQPVNVQSFTTDFTFQLSNPLADGITFTIQNVGPTALGGYGSGLGFVTIQKSIAIKFDLYNNSGEGPDSTGLYLSGNLPTNIGSINLSNTPINLHSGDYMNAHITYDSINLTLTITNDVSLESWSYSWPVNIPALVGGNTAWVGFTGSTGAQTSSQKVTYWTYVPGPPSQPNYPVGFDHNVMYYNNAWLNGTMVQTASGGGHETNSAYYYLPVDIETFTTNFDFVVTKGSTSALGNGLTFTIQNQGLNALGSSGSGLGYAGIPHSLAIKFDFSTLVGTGTNSTGLFLNGAMPTTPAESLVPNNLVLNTGDKIHVLITYDGINLYWKIQDVSAAQLEIFSNTVQINIPNVIGSNTAYVGFTGATGTTDSNQDILDWTFNNTP
jgi:hypothetical protein